MKVPDRHPRLIVPEVVQTSAMDCGPAVLKAALEGFGIPVSYGRLREACQTDVDGTSINTLEEVARHLGLDAEQVMLPVDHLLFPQAGALPALLVTATRLVAVLVQGRGVRSGHEARAVLRSFLEPAQTIPDPYWSVRPAPASPLTPPSPPSDGGEGGVRGGEEQLVLRGAVLVP